MKILDGKKISALIKEEISLEVKKIISNNGKRPHLSAILVGENGASQTYVNAKVKACEKVGFESTLIRLDNNITQEQLLEEINKININKMWLATFTLFVPLFYIIVICFDVYKRGA